MAAEKSRILIIGGTGYIGKFIVKASARAGHPTFALVRESTSADPAKAKILGEFQEAGVTIVHGDLYDHETLVKAVKEVDVVISTVGQGQLADQTRIITAIKEAGNIKRFLPSEFGNDADRSSAVEPAKAALGIKIKIRRAIEAENIPYTYVSSYFFAGFFLPNLGQATTRSLPTDKVFILGDGNTKAIFNNEDDIGAFTIKATDDSRTLNKVLYLRPPGNIYSHNELVSLWEKKTGKIFERVYISEEDLIKQIIEAPLPVNIIQSIHHAVFLKGDHTIFEIGSSFGVEATQLYPDVKYTTVAEYLNRKCEGYIQAMQLLGSSPKEIKYLLLLLLMLLMWTVFSSTVGEVRVRFLLKPNFSIVNSCSLGENGVVVRTLNGDIQESVF